MTGPDNARWTANDPNTLNTDTVTATSNYTNSLIAIPTNYVIRDVANQIVSRIGIDNVIVIHGMGGIGKSSILMKIYKDKVADRIAYLDLKNKPPFISVAKLILQNVYKVTPSTEDENELAMNIIQRFEESNKSLIIFDNLESIMDETGGTGKIIDEYAGYANFIAKALSYHTGSTVILSGREKIELSARYYENYHDYKIEGIGVEQAKQWLLSEKDFEMLEGSDEDWTQFVNTYSGNPLAMKIVAVEIRDLYDGCIREYLIDPEIPHELRSLLEEQFNRFSNTEKIILYWYAVEREAMSESDARNKLVGLDASRAIIRQDFRTIYSRGFLEKSSASGDTTYYLQPVILEFLSGKLIQTFIQEILDENIDNIKYVSLLDTDSKEFILSIQRKILLDPIINELDQRLGLNIAKHKIKKLIEKVETERSYASGNIINLLASIDSNSNIEEMSFENRYIINADMRFVNVKKCDFSGATFINVLFRNTFGNLIDVKYSFDGEYILGGATDYSINAWNSRDLSYSFKINAHSDWIRSVDSNSKYLVSASNDETISVFDYSTRQPLKRFRAESRVRKVRLAQNADEYVYSSGDDKLIRKWNIKTGECEIFKGHDNVVWDFVLIPRETPECIVSVSDDHKAILWDFNDGSKTVLFEYECGIESVTYDDVTHTLFLGCENGTIVEYSMTTRNSKSLLQGHAGVIWGMDFNSEKRKLISGSADKHVIVWHNENNRWEKERILDAHNSAVWNVNFSKDATSFVTTGDDSEFKVWDAATYRPLHCIKGYTNLLRNLHISKKDDSLYVAGDDAIIRQYSKNQWDSPNKRFIRHTNRVRHIDISPNGEKMLSCSDDGTVILWDLSTHECKVFYGHKKRVWSVCFISDTQFASAGEENDIYLWDIHSNCPYGYLKGHNSWIWDVSYNSDSNLLASAGEDDSCIIWDLEQQKPQVVLKDHAKWLFAVAISENGHYIITASADNNAIVYDTFCQKKICELKGHIGWVWSAVFINDQLVATGSQDSTIRIWEIDRRNNMGICKRVFDKHTSWVVSLDVSIDRKILFSASADETVKMWDLEKLEYIRDVYIDKPYSGMRISNTIGISESERESLRQMGAVY